jgi:hypothetical protein
LARLLLLAKPSPLQQNGNKLNILARLLLLAKPSPLQQNGNMLNIGQASPAGETLTSATKWQ